MLLILVQMALLLVLGCSAGVERDIAYEYKAQPGSSFSIIRTVGNLSLGEPLAIAMDPAGNPLIADGLPGRIVWISSSGDEALEYQQPTHSRSFYPSDLKLSGFFIYAVDAVARVLLRFDTRGAYRDILVSFDDVFVGQRVSPVGLDVDGSGRIAVTDVKNHQVILFDTYLAVELTFGSYGSFPGRLDSPEGVSFADNGDVIVADTGNRRVQLFDSGGKLLGIIPREGDANPFVRPRRAVHDHEGNIYVADPDAGKVLVFDQSGRLTRSLGPAEGEFRPSDIEVGRSGVIYVTEMASSSLFVFR